MRPLTVVSFLVYHLFQVTSAFWKMWSAILLRCAFPTYYKSETFLPFMFIFCTEITTASWLRMGFLTFNFGKKNAITIFQQRETRKNNRVLIIWPLSGKVSRHWQQLLKKVSRGIRHVGMLVILLCTVISFKGKKLEIGWKTTAVKWNLHYTGLQGREWVFFVRRLLLKHKS